MTEAKRPALTRLPSGLVVPTLSAATAATPGVTSADEAAQPAQSAPSSVESGISRSKKQAILDAPEKMDPAVVRVLLSPAVYSFRFNRKTGVVQTYDAPRAVRRQRMLEERRAARKARKNGG